MRRTAAHFGEFRPVRASLSDIVGREYVKAVCDARSFLSGESADSLRKAAAEKVELYPKAFQARLRSLLPSVGRLCAAPLASSAAGATTAAYSRNSRAAWSPLSGLGYYRLGEDGRLFLLSKSEHYHTPLGHGFPGFRLLETARRLGIPNATHNNTRGHITRLLESELVRTANGLGRGDQTGLARILKDNRLGVLNRVINLETGSLAAEAAIKLALGRFFRLQEDSPACKYEGRTPVFLVMGGNDGALQANYHGTTITAQMLRGLWTDLYSRQVKAGAFRVCPVRPNNTDDLDRAFRTWDRGAFKIAAFFHEIVMMNYGGILLKPAFLKRAYHLCEKHDVPVCVDEIQSCAWSPRIYLFREYGLKPSMLALGKGMPAGEYPASRILFSAALDTLPQFGALVTNGQEEIASLAYLITMRWIEENAGKISEVGEYYESELRRLAKKHRGKIDGIEGRRHLGAIRFGALEPAKAFASALNNAGLDISVQTYKTSIPPAALTKLPIIAERAFVDKAIGLMEQAL